jgi:PPOX class probable F420-dependent enzyme
MTIDSGQGSLRDRDAQTGTMVGGLSWRRSAHLDEAVCALLTAKNICVVATLTPRGGIQATPVWVDTDGEHVLLNSVDGRTWVRNLDRDPRVTCTIVQADNPYEFVEIRGRVVERTYEGGNAHIHKLARKYLGVDEYPWLEPGDRRVLFKVAPDKVFHMRPAAIELEQQAEANGE